MTKNEEDKIAHCLESVKWADEIVIVDGFSTDRTVEICRKYTDRIIQDRSDGCCDRTRNLGTDNATGDWILQLDADDVVTEGFRQAVQKILEEDNPEFNAYRFIRKNFFLGHFLRYGGWYHYSLHFLRRGFARYKGRIHEALIVDGKIGQIEAEIEHYPYNTLWDWVDRMNRYSIREAQAILDTKGILTDKEIKYNLTMRPLKLFWKTYIKKKGYKDGMYGLIYALLSTFSYSVKWAKYWELVNESTFNKSSLER
jgi:glycosyltransferase involved in cell wall biosynthesis